MNYARTGLLLAALTGLFVGVGYAIGGGGGMLVTFLIAMAMNLFAYWNSDRMVLGIYRARPVDAASAPQYHATVQELARRAGLPMPRLYLIESEQPNAFATGRNPENAAVAATTGLLRRLMPEEVAGVIAHELTHVKNRDTLTMTVTATLAGAIGMLANFALFFGGGRAGRNNPLGVVGVLLVSILAPLMAMLVQMAISRSREHEADRGGAEITGRPLWLASALEKIDRSHQRIANPAAEANPATAHLFIVNPLSGSGIGSLFATHPSTAERVRRLRAMADEMGQAGAAMAQPSSGPWG